jgi:hypothetical protein
MELTDTDAWRGLLGACPPWASPGLTVQLGAQGPHTQPYLIHAGTGEVSPDESSRDPPSLGQASGHRQHPNDSISTSRISLGPQGTPQEGRDPHRLRSEEGRTEVNLE